jgi:two-component system, cell cycle sensor histidine kinase and response regulator CckA
VISQRNFDTMNHGPFIDPQLPNDPHDDFAQTNRLRLGQLLKNNIDQLDIAIWELDLEYRIVASNQNARHIFGAEIDGSRCYQVCARTDGVCLQCPVKQVYAERRCIRSETTGFDQRGAKIYLDHIATPILNDQGDLTGALVLLIDIGLRKAHERELIDKHDQLEKKLQQSQRLESIGRLAGGVAHDLNNLLFPILGYAEMLIEDFRGNAALCGPIGEILRAGQRARELTAQLLAFSRKQTLEFKPIELNRLLQTFKKLLRRTIRENIEIQMKLDAELPLIIGDSGQLEQVIMNLAVNAQDAMPDGGRLIFETASVDPHFDVARLTDHDPRIRYVMLAVSDNGCGMDTAVQTHLFEPFFTTKERHRGTGLGLSTVYGIVKQHGGFIWVYSEPQVGTCFKVYLPIPNEVIKKAAKPDSPPPDHLNGNETILIAEDNEGVRTLAQLVLERNGYTVFAAADVGEALAFAHRSRTHIDLLLTDVVMPELNGKELYNRIRERFPRLKVLYMSGYTDNVVSHYGILDDGVNFIQKPFSNIGLATKLREVLDTP